MNDSSEHINQNRPHEIVSDQQNKKVKTIDDTSQTLLSKKEE